MRKKKIFLSLLCCLLCAAAILTGVTLWIRGTMPDYPDSLGSDPNVTEKITGLYLMRQAAQEPDTLLVFGSSELKTTDICSHPANFFAERRCGKCGRPLSQNDPGEICFRCAVRESSEDPQSFDKGHACAGYGAVEQSVIFALKYGSRPDIGDALGEILYDRMVSEYGADVLAGMYDLVTPVPTHRDKRAVRGYNHADLMGKSFARRAGLRYDPETVIRTRPTIPMKGLGPEARKANIHGAFDVRARRLPQIAGARILLIDDIFTTGATIDEIARILKDAGASRVDFLAFAAAGDMIN